MSRLTRHFSDPARCCRTYAWAAGLLALGCGVAVLIGWLFHFQTLLTILSGAVTMKPNTAICFCLGGVGLALLREKRDGAPIPVASRLLGGLCAGLIALVGAVTLGEDWFGWNVGIDQFFLHDGLTQTAAVPGRMAPISALAFVFVGVAQLLNGGCGKHRRSAQGLALLALLIGTTGMLGYVYEAPTLVRQPGHAVMAVHTAWLFIVLSSGIILARPGGGLMSVLTSEHGGGVMCRRILPFAITLPFVLRYFREYGQHVGWFDLELGLVLSLISNVVLVSALIWLSARALNRLDTHRRSAEGLLVQAHEELEQRVADRTAELNAAQKKLWEVLNASKSVSVLACDLTGTITLFNAGAEQMLGYRASEVIGKSGLELLHLQSEITAHGRELTLELGRPIVGIEVFAEHARNNALKAREWTYRHKDGRALTVMMDVTATRDETGEVTGFLSIATDVTERKRAENELRRLQQFQGAILAHIGQGIHGIDASGNIVFENPAAAQMLGCVAEELIGQTALETGHQQVDGSFYRVNEAVIHSTLRSGEVQCVTDEIFWRKDGTLFPVEYSVAPMRTDTGEISGAVVVFSDISLRKQGEAVMVHAKEAAETATRIKSQFLANMSHEIRTPMNGVVGMTSLLLDTELSAEQREFAETIRASAELQLTIINDILDFSKVESGKLVFEELDFDLHETVEGTVELLASGAQKKGIALECYVDQNVAPRLRGDAGRLRQVLTNLLGNAIKFTSAGSVSLHVSVDREECQVSAPAREEQSPHVRLRFEIEDTGIGIPADVQPRLFQAFVQADGSTTRKYGGTGLGLAICRQIVEQMEGRIGVRCDRGQGSTFWFTVQLPMQTPVVPPPVPAGHWHRTRVLAVDTNLVNRRFLCSQVRDWGMRNGCAETGAETLSMLRDAVEENDPYAVAIIDRQVSDMDGLTLARAIKADPLIADTRLVMLTPLGKPLSVAELALHQIAASRSKPVRQSAMFACIASVLGMDLVPPSQKRLDLPEALENSTTPVEQTSFRGKYVLVAEDNVVNQRVALGQLKKLGFRADAVANGREALHALEHIPYDVVMMDCQMPEMDGYEATAEIRRREDGKRRTWIIAMTANAMKGDREKCLDSGMDDYLSKPTAFADLSAALARHAALSASRTVEQRV